MPIVLAYTAWVCSALLGPVTAQKIQSGPHMKY